MKKEEIYEPYPLIPLIIPKYVSKDVADLVNYYGEKADKKTFPKLFDSESGISEDIGPWDIQWLLLHFLNWCGKRKIYLRQQ